MFQTLIIAPPPPIAPPPFLIPGYFHRHASSFGNMSKQVWNVSSGWRQKLDLWHPTTTCTIDFAMENERRINFNFCGFSWKLCVNNSKSFYKDTFGTQSVLFNKKFNYDWFPLHYTMYVKKITLNYFQEKRVSLQSVWAIFDVHRIKK